MSSKEHENKAVFTSPKGESFHDSQTESDSTNRNQNSSQKENITNNNNLNEEKVQNEETNDNLDHIAYDPKLLNINDLPFPDLSLRKETTKESQLSIDNPDISKQHLKEYLNEDLIKALGVSPMVTPKSSLKDAANENNNDLNNENIIPISEDMMNGSNNDLFQFSLYNNSGNIKNENDNNLNNKESNTIKNPIDELIKISVNNEEQNKTKLQKEEDDFNDNKIMESFIPPNLSLNNMKSISEISNDINNEISNKNSINPDEIQHIIEDEGGGNKINAINNEKDSPIKEKIGMENKSNQNENANQNINKDFKAEINNNNFNKFSQNAEKKNEFGENRNNLNNTNKNFIPLQMQHPYMPHMIHFPYGSQPHIIQTLPPNIHENKFDGNKKYNIVIPIPLKKNNPKIKKPFEVREGDWTCSDCGNLNFSFRVKCNRCGIPKEISEEKKSKNNNSNEKKQGNTNAKDNNTNNNTNNYYQNMNMMPYKGVVFQSPLYNKGETFYPKYYSGYIYVPVQNKYMNKNNNNDKNKKDNNDRQKEDKKKEEKPEKK